MKQTLRITFALSALFLVACQGDNTSEGVYGDGATTLTVALPTTRTSLGDKSGDTYPVYWSEGDKIAVNGAESAAAVVDASNASLANFTFSSALSYPYNITYPYTSTTTAEVAKVIFPAEQNYVKGSFGAGDAPMCGYVASKGDRVALKHLAGVLKFPIKANRKGVVLHKIVVTSTSGASLSGEFAVNCQEVTITPTENCGGAVTYLLPSNFTLSTSEASECYISLPSGELGECMVEFVDADGGVMVGKWNANNLRAGVVREFKTITYEVGALFALTALGSEEDAFDINPSAPVRGYVRDDSGNGIEGVAVSDGFSVVTTNAEGYYSINVSSNTWYIYISIPSEYEIPRGEYGLPCFYKRYNPAQRQYDFELKPLVGGKEEKFALFAIADVHITTKDKAEKFKNSVVSHLNKQYNQYAEQGVSAYCVNLGDNITNYDKHNTSAWRDDILPGMETSQAPIFSVFGNHDCCYFDANSPLVTDDRSSTYNLKAQREFEDMFGPVNYSFNRGDTHIICMRDILYTNPDVCAIERGFTVEQYNWLKQDLANVPKDKMVVLCVHHQLYNADSPYCQEILSMLDDYKEGHIMSGHSHIQRNLRYGNHNDIYEHVTCSVGGPVWTFDLCGDGTPCGYQIFEAEGAHFADWYYISYLEGRDTRDSQFHLYRGNARTGAPISGTNNNGTKGYYQFNFSENTILANVYNADSRWKISVYEDGEYSGAMTQLPGAKPAYSELIGDGSYENPFRYAEGVVTGYDFYVGGFHLGLKGRQTSHSGAWVQCVHMYKYELKNKDAKVKVVVTDFFGKEYTMEEFVDGTTYTF